MTDNSALSYRYNHVYADVESIINYVFFVGFFRQRTKDYMESVIAAFLSGDFSEVIDTAETTGKLTQGPLEVCAALQRSIINQWES